jgi:hypothetical protein
MGDANDPEWWETVGRVKRLIRINPPDLTEVDISVTGTSVPIVDEPPSRLGERYNHPVPATLLLRVCLCCYFVILSFVEATSQSDELRNLCRVSFILNSLW